MTCESLPSTLTCKCASSSGAAEEDPGGDGSRPLWKCETELPVCRNPRGFYHLLDKRFAVNSPGQEKVGRLSSPTVHSLSLCFLVWLSKKPIREKERQVGAEIPYPTSLAMKCLSPTKGSWAKGLIDRWWALENELECEGSDRTGQSSDGFLTWWHYWGGGWKLGYGAWLKQVVWGVPLEVSCLWLLSVCFLVAVKWGLPASMPFFHDRDPETGSQPATAWNLESKGSLSSFYIVCQTFLSEWRKANPVSRRLELSSCPDREHGGWLWLQLCHLWAVEVAGSLATVFSHDTYSVTF